MSLDWGLERLPWAIFSLTGFFLCSISRLRAVSMTQPGGGSQFYGPVRPPLIAMRSQVPDRRTWPRLPCCHDDTVPGRSGAVSVVRHSLVERFRLGLARRSGEIMNYSLPLPFARSSGGRLSCAGSRQVFFLFFELKGPQANKRWVIELWGRSMTVDMTNAQRRRSAVGDNGDVAALRVTRGGWLERKASSMKIEEKEVKWKNGSLALEIVGNPAWKYHRPISIGKNEKIKVFYSNAISTLIFHQIEGNI